MPPKSKAAAAAAVDTSDLYIPGQRYKWLEYEEIGVEGASRIRAKVRTSLTGAEHEALRFDEETPIEEAWALYAPYVVEWNVGALDEDGKPFRVKPPAEGGPEMFDFIPRGLFYRFTIDMRRVLVKPVDPKSSSRPAPTDGPPPSENEIPV